MGFFDWIFPKFKNGSLSFGESSTKPKKVIELNFTLRHLVFAIVGLVCLVLLFNYTKPFGEHLYVGCEDGTKEEVTENKTIYCGEDIGNMTIRDYINIKNEEAREQLQPKFY